MRPVTIVIIIDEKYTYEMMHRLKPVLYRIDIEDFHFKRYKRLLITYLN